MKRLLLFITPIIISVFTTQAKKHAPISYRLTEKGGLEYVYFPATKCDTLYFWDKESGGPSLYLNDKALTLTLQKNGMFTGKAEGISYSLNYHTDGEKLKIGIMCKNESGQDLKDLQLSLHMGINTTMTHYPEWRSVYFPTLMRCEKTHFWGYLMNPNGSIVTIASPDPIASYHLFYNNDFKSFGSGHLIRSFSLDLLNPGPLPERNPQNASNLYKDQSREWTIRLGATRNLDNIIPDIAKQTQAPVITSDFYTVADGEKVNLTIQATSRPTLSVKTPEGQTINLNLQTRNPNSYSATFKPSAGKGVYTLTAKDSKGKTGEAKVSVRYPWSDYMKSARRAALKYPQKNGSHVESWYGMFPAYIAMEYFPDAACDKSVDEKFNEIYPLVYDTITHLPNSERNRIQNHAMMASLRVQRYKARKDIADLRAAANLADFILAQQTPDGAYRNGRTHYTSVIYIAKAIMEVMEQEKILAATSDEWKANYDRHYHSVKKAVDELARNLDNIQTEGEMTYEDGMISCSYSQISMFALLQPEGSPERQKYIDAAEFLVRGHRCLSQLLVPDSRMNGGSLRYWEAQYDILTFPNMLNSPHGWSAWRIYGLAYLYELTGKEEYLTGMINALGSCAQLLNPANDHLNWAFVCDPYLKVNRFIEDPQNKGKGIHEHQIIGEQYMPMISDWYRAPANTWVSGYWNYDGGCCDNDVHEIFKCMGEIVLTSAYVHQRADGSLLSWNCKAEKQGNRIVVTPDETCIKKIFVNLYKSDSVDIISSGKRQSSTLQKGWIKLS